jgi:D-alanine--poly(phosphoribitol) ligase subunit 2
MSQSGPNEVIVEKGGPLGRGQDPLSLPVAPSLDGAVRGRTASLLTEIEAIFLEELNIAVPSSSADLFAAGILDSMGLVQLLLQLEERFGLRLPIEDLELDSFRTLQKITEVVAGQEKSRGGQ